MTRSTGALVSWSWLAMASDTPNTIAHSIAPIGLPRTMEDAHRPMYPRPATIFLVNAEV